MLMLLRKYFIMGIIKLLSLLTIIVSYITQHSSHADNYINIAIIL
jgi:hypothetical protein